MSDFIIYSMGDYEFLRLALLGLSHAFEQGALSIAKIGLVLSLLAIFWQGIWNPGKIEFKQFFMSFFLIIILFGKQVDYILIHSDGAGADSMPPIPIGIALGATVATNFGFGLANGLREFYHTTYVPGSTRTGDYRAMLDGHDGHGGYTKVAGNGLEPLRELMKMRFDGHTEAFSSNVSYKAAVTQTGDAATAPDYGRSIQNYINDCVLKDLYNQKSVQEVNETAMHNAPYAWDHMKVAYNGWTTNIKINAGHGWEIKGCGDAYTALTGVFDSEFKNIALAQAGIQEQAKEDLIATGRNMLASGAMDAWKVKVNGLMMYHYRKAKTKSRWASDAELMASQAEYEAMESRRMSSTVQYSLWAEMAKPLITYIEAFVFLIGPLMPFVAAFGEKGLGMVMKYFFMLLWVNTWPILQVGVNMYLQHYINKASFQDQFYDPFSWAGYNTSFTQLESFISMGATLQTMVPALSLMLLYGSVHTAINLANGAQKGGGSEGAGAVPKAMGEAHSGKLTAGNQTQTYDSATGGITSAYTGGGDVVRGGKQFAMNDAINNSTQDNLTRANTVMKQSTDQLSNSIQEMAQNFTKSADGKSFNVAEGSQHMSGIRAMAGWTKQLANNSQMSDDQKLQSAFVLSGGMGAKAQLDMAASLGFSMDKVNAVNNAAGHSNTTATTKSTQSKGNVVPKKTETETKSNTVTATNGDSKSNGVSARVGGSAAVTAEATVKGDLGTADGHSKSKSQTATNGESASKTEDESVQKNKSAQKQNGTTFSNDNAWGSSATNLRASMTSYSNAEQEQQAEAKIAQAMQGVSSQLSFNFTPLTSDGSNNKALGKLEDGSWMRDRDHAVMTGAMSNEEKAAFNNFKAEGGYAEGKDGDIKAFRDFAKTDAGKEHADVADKLKTTDEHQEKFMNWMKDQGATGGSTADYKNAAVRYADEEFQNVMSNFEEYRFEGASAMLETGNENMGGKVAEWQAAANQFKEFDKKADEALKMDPVDQSGRDKAGVKPNEVTAAIGSAKEATTKAENIVNTGDPNQEFNPNKPGLDPTLSPEAQRKKAELEAETTAAVKDSQELSEKAKPVLEAKDKVDPVIQKAANGVAEAAIGIVDWVNGSEREQAGDRLKEQGVTDRAAKIMTGSDESHSAIQQTITDANSSNATMQDKQKLMDLVSSRDAIEKEAQTILNDPKTDNEKRELAENMMKNVQSLDDMLGRADMDAGQKGLYQGLADEVSKGNMTSAEATNAMALATSNTHIMPNGFVNNFDGARSDIADGRKAMEMMESRGLQNTQEYQNLQNRVEATQQWMDKNSERVALSDAVRAYDGQVKGDGYGGSPVDLSHGNYTQTREDMLKNSDIGKFLDAAIKGENLGDFSRANIDDALGKHEQPGFFMSLMGDSSHDKNVNAIERYSEIREGLIAAQSQLAANGNTDAAERVGDAISTMDKNTGFDKRLEGFDTMKIDSNQNGDSTEISRGSFEQLHSADNNQKVDIDGQSYRKVDSSTSEDGLQTVTLQSTSDDRAEPVTFTMNSEGFGDLSVNKDEITATPPAAPAQAEGQATKGTASEPQSTPVQTEVQPVASTASEGQAGPAQAEDQATIGTASEPQSTPVQTEVQPIASTASEGQAGPAQAKDQATIGTASEPQSTPVQTEGQPVASTASEVTATPAQTDGQATIDTASEPQSTPVQTEVQPVASTAIEATSAPAQTDGQATIDTASEPQSTPVQTEVQPVASTAIEATSAPAQAEGQATIGTASEPQSTPVQTEGQPVASTASEGQAGPAQADGQATIGTASEPQSTPVQTEGQPVASTASEGQAGPAQADGQATTGTVSEPQSTPVQTEGQAEASTASEVTAAPAQADGQATIGTASEPQSTPVQTEGQAVASTANEVTAAPAQAEDQATIGTASEPQSTPIQTEGQAVASTASEGQAGSAQDDGQATTGTVSEPQSTPVQTEGQPVASTVSVAQPAPSNGATHSGQVQQDAPGNSSPGTSEPVKVESTINGDGATVTPEAFDKMFNAEDGQKFEIGGESYTKVSSSEATDYGLEKIELLSDSNPGAEPVTMHLNSSGAGNLTIYND